VKSELKTNLQQSGYTLYYPALKRQGVNFCRSGQYLPSLACSQTSAYNMSQAEGEFALVFTLQPRNSLAPKEADMAKTEMNDIVSLDVYFDYL
jgi:hypothetical protein